MTPAKLRLAQAAMGQPGTKVGELCTELGITRQTLYRHVDPAGRLRADGEKLLGRGASTGPRASVQAQDCDVRGKILGGRRKAHSALS